MEKTKIYVVKVRVNKANGQRVVTIPKEATDIGEYVELKNHVLSSNTAKTGGKKNCI
jgi:hypothetical protein